MAPAHEDGVLVEKAKADPRFFGVLYQKYFQKIYTYFLYRVSFDVELVQDLTQETFLKAFAHLGQFTDRGHSYLSYLLSIAHNLLVNHFRKPQEQPLEAWEDVLAAEHHDIDRELNRSKLWKAVERLKPSERNVLVLFYREHFSIKQIASALKKTENASKLLLSRARKKLTQELSVAGALAPPLQPSPLLI